MDITCDLDMSGVTLWGQKPYPNPAKVSGQVKSYLGIITLQYGVQYTFHGACARCLAPVVEELDFSSEHTIMDKRPDEDGVPSQEPDDQFILAQNGVLDLDELIIADLLLSQEGVPLCGEDCRGLCPQCGTNLNTDTCPCSEDTGQGGVKKPDSRFAALLEFMEETNE